MSKDIAFIHTTSLVIEPVKKNIEKLTGSHSFFHLLDEALLRCMMNEGNTPERTVPWLVNLLNNAIRGGASGAVVSCSSLSMSVDQVRGLVDIPVESIDRALYDYVLTHCRNPVVLMTNPTNKEPAAHMQKLLGSSMPVRLCPGAFESLTRGDGDKHDRQVVEEIEKLASGHDGILLSQISMERVRALLPADLRKTVFSSLDFLDKTIEKVAGEA